MKIYGIKCKEMMVCMCGGMARIAEAEVETDTPNRDTVYVTVQEYDGQDFSVSTKSLFDFIIDEGNEPADGDFIEEFSELKKAKESAYAKVYEKLRKVIKMMGVIE